MSSQACTSFTTSFIHTRCKLCNNDIHLGRAIESHYKGKKHIAREKQSSIGNTNLIISYLRPAAALIDTRTSSTSEQLGIIDVTASSSPNDITSTTITSPSPTASTSTYNN